MNRVTTLQHAVRQFEVEFSYCTPQKYTSIQGFSYLICKEKQSAKGSIHYNEYSDYTDFSSYLGNNAKLSTKQHLKLGDIVFYQNFTFAVKSKLFYNETMGLHHYELISSSDYFNNFILTDKEIQDKMLGSDITRYILGLTFPIPIIPAKLQPELQEAHTFIAFEILETRAHSMPSLIMKDEKQVLQQAKSDYVRFLAINLNTNELQEFLMCLTQSTTFGYAGMPSFKASIDTFKPYFNIKANIQELTIQLNYCIDSEYKADEKVIESINLHLSNLTQGDKHE